MGRQKGQFLLQKMARYLIAPAPKGKLINGSRRRRFNGCRFCGRLDQKQDYEYAFHMGVASGSASAFSENLATKEEIINVYNQVMGK